MDWSYEHAVLYHCVEYKTIESVWTKQLYLPQLQQIFFNNDDCNFRVTIVIGMW